MASKGSIGALTRAFTSLGKRKAKASSANRSKRRKTTQANQNTMSSSVAASAYGTTTITGVAQQKASNRGHIVTHRELIGSVNGSVNYAISTKIPLNPGLASTFPWMCTVARQFEQYTIKSAAILFVSTSSTGAKGAVIIAPEYDATATDPATETIATQMNGCIEAPTWQTTRCSLDTNAMHNDSIRKYVRVGNASGDLRLMDAGKVFICTTGQADTTPIGKIWIEYTIEFHKPHHNANEPSTLMTYASKRTSFFSNAGLGDQTLANNTTTAINLQVVDNPQYTDPLNLSTTTAFTSLTPPAGVYLVTAIVSYLGSSAGLLLAKLQVYVGGIAVDNRLSPLAYISTTSTSVGTAGTLVTRAILPLNGAQTVGFYSNLNAASGTVTIPDGGAFITFELA